MAILTRITILVATGVALPSAVLAAGDFPLASCSGWNGTVVDLVGRDTGSARMEGIVSKADLREYCERDPGGETTQYGGSMSVDQCVERYFGEERATQLIATADCAAGRVASMSSGHATSASFPLAADADTSCASGMPPLIEQFKLMCPAVAARLGVE